MGVKGAKGDVKGGPLRGLRVAITASRRGEELARLITSLGGEPYLAPTVGIGLREDIGEEVKRFLEALVGSKRDGGSCYAIFMTGPGVYSLFSEADRLGLGAQLREGLKGCIIVARSPKPQEALSKHGIEVHLVAEENTAEGIVEMLEGRVKEGDRLLVLWHGSYSPVLREKLGGRAQVLEFSTYNYSPQLEEKGREVLTTMGFRVVEPEEERVLRLIDEIEKGSIHVITFTSPPAARNLLEMAAKYGREERLKESLNERVLVVAVGPPTRLSLEERGVKVDVMPSIYKMGPMMKALCDHLASGGPKVGKILAAP